VDTTHDVFAAMFEVPASESEYVAFLNQRKMRG
jgi:hypothetical protein